MLSVVNADGSAEPGSLIDDIGREGARWMLAAALEAEVDAYIAELADERDVKGIAWPYAMAIASRGR